MKRPEYFRTYKKSSKKSKEDVARELNKALSRMAFTGTENGGASLPKRVGNLLFAGAVVAGCMFPRTTNAYTANLPATNTTVLSVQNENPTATYSLMATRGNSGSKNSSSVSLSPPVADSQGVFPSLGDYVGKLICSGCGKRCPLTAPQCGIGTSQYEQAVTLYENTVYSAPTTSAPVETEEPTATDKLITPQEKVATATAPATSSVADETDNSEISDSAESTDSAALQNFLSGLFCSGCGKHCPLTALQCGRGQPYLEQAKAEFVALNTQQTSNVETSVTTDTDSQKAGATMNNIIEYIPIGGLVVGGVYYTIDIMKKKRTDSSSGRNGGGHDEQ